MKFKVYPNSFRIQFKKPDAVPADKQISETI